MNPSSVRYPGAVVSAQWLAEHGDEPHVRIVDATVHLPDTGGDAKGGRRHELPAATSN